MWLQNIKIYNNSSKILKLKPLEYEFINNYFYFEAKFDERIF